MTSFRRAVLAAILALAVPVTACTTRTGPEFPDASLDASYLFVDAGPDGGGSDAGPPVDGGPRLDDVLIYAHSADTLYTFSPYTNTVATIGDFTLPGGGNPGAMLDLAVNADGVIYTSNDSSLFRVDATTAVCTLVGDFGLPSGEELFALTFLVPGEFRPTETLIGATNEGVYYEIVLPSPRATRIGNYPDGWLSSGDLVSVEGLGTFATLRTEDRTVPDVLARIDFRAGGTSTVTVLGSTGYTALYGLGAWGRVLYGFSSRGELIEINRTTGAGTIATEDTGTTQFWGAGVTTQVPILF